MMKFKKGKFAVRKDLSISKGEGAEMKSGWISEDGQYGFHRSASGWIVTDIASGSSIRWEPTRKACARYVEEQAELIAKMRLAPNYKRYTEELIVLKRLLSL